MALYAKRRSIDASASILEQIVILDFLGGSAVRIDYSGSVYVRAIELQVEISVYGEYRIAELFSVQSTQGK